MSVGPSDVVNGIKLAVKIYEYGFSEENKASVRYRVFKNDVYNFRYLLAKLDESLRGAQERYRLRGSVLAVQAYDPLSKDIENERKFIIGNFLATLQECEALLEQRKQFGFQNSSIAQNITSNINQHEQRVDHLRSRLHFHSEKIHLVLDRLSVNLLTDIDAKVDDILAVSEQNLQVSRDIQSEIRRFRASWVGHASGGVLPTASVVEDNHPLSDGIALRFLECLLANPPVVIESGIPLIEGFDALLFQFQEYTAIQDPTDQKYLLFLKMRWLIDRLREGPEYQAARPGYYYKRAIYQIEQAILARSRSSGGLIAYDDPTLLGLEETCFHIWPPSASVADDQGAPNPLILGSHEEQVASIELATSGPSGPDTVTVFKSSDETLRVVYQSTLASDPSKAIITGQTVHVREDKLIPRYALPTLLNPCLELAIFSRNVETVYRFASLHDLHKFQTALMGYEVSHDQPKILCQFSHDVSSLNCVGRIQLWQDPVGPHPAMVANGTSQVSPRSPTSFSRRSGSRRDSLNPSLAGTSTILPTQDGWEGGKIKLPVIAIITQLTDSRKKRKRFATIFIELGPTIQVSSRDCGCHRDYESCPVLVLTAPAAKSKTFTVRVVYSDADAEGRPIANTFDIFPLRTPCHPDFHRCTTKQTEHLVLKFQTLPEKVLFHRELDCRFNVRDTQIKDQRIFENTVFYRADHPQRHHQQNMSPNLRQMSSAFEQMSVKSAPVRSHPPSNNRDGSTSTASTGSSANITSPPPETAARKSCPAAPTSTSTPRTANPMAYGRIEQHRAPTTQGSSVQDGRASLHSEFPISKPKTAKKKKSFWQLM